MTRITAHAGCDGTRPGSLEGLYAAIEAGADALELDLRLYAGEVLLSHDPICAERLSEYVRLETVLTDRRIREARVRFNCDLKERKVFPAVLRLFREKGMEELLEFTGMYPIEADDWDARYRVYQNVEDLPGFQGGGVLSAEQTLDAIAWFQKMRTFRHCLAGLNIEVAQLCEENLGLFRENGIALTCWGANDAEQLGLCFTAEAVENITTDAVRDACAFRKARAFSNAI